MRKKKQAITHQTIQKNKNSFQQSRSGTAKLIRRFHVLNKELSKCRAQDHVDRTREQAILKEMDDIGGLDLYQKASLLGQSPRRGGDTSKWLLKTLQTHNITKAVAKPIRMLEVGALSPENYKDHKWIHVYPIDLNPQHELIQKQDFLTMPVPSTEDAKFDIVSLSLVVNFVGDAPSRGKMLLHTRDFLYSVQNKDRLHHLFVVLPLPCLENSRYMSKEVFQDMMTDMGYTKIDEHFSNKLAYYLFELKGRPASVGPFAKKLLPGKEGGKRNNFSITIDSPKKK
ncbi:hypothetical protein DM01DRAFT_1078103, partial [Hesseltinella vesiculosa]